jgi:DNA-3-methyladenine glycosylase
MTPIVEAKLLQAKKTVALARWLLGKHLVRRFPDGRTEARMIVETEAYDGEEDQACHARAGRTARTDVMYGPGGVWYVYLCYGILEMLNLVVGPTGWPAAILIRGVEGAIGPGRVTKALEIDRKLNRASATDHGSGLWIEDRGVRIPRKFVTVTPRVGVDYAGPIWSMKHWRFTFDPQGVPRPRAEPPPPKLNSERDPAGAPERWEPVGPKSPDPSVRTRARRARRTPQRGD